MPLLLLTIDRGWGFFAVLLRYYCVTIAVAIAFTVTVTSADNTCCHLYRRKFHIWRRAARQRLLCGVQPDVSLSLRALEQREVICFVAPGWLVLPIWSQIPALAALVGAPAARGSCC